MLFLSIDTHKKHEKLKDNNLANLSKNVLRRFEYILFLKVIIIAFAYKKKY